MKFVRIVIEPFGSFSSMVRRLLSVCVFVNCRSNYVASLEICGSKDKWQSLGNK